MSRNTLRNIVTILYKDTNTFFGIIANEYVLLTCLVPAVKKVKHLLLIQYVITHFVTQIVKETDFSICVLNVKAANDLPHKFILMNTIGLKHIYKLPATGFHLSQKMNFFYFDQTWFWMKVHVP